MVALEQRMVFDGAIAVTDPNLIDRDTGLQLSAIAEAASRAASVDAPREAARREIVFVDDALSDLQGLLAGFGSAAEVVQIQHSQDGLAQINAALAGRGTFDAIHILAHGSAGSQTIGATTLDAAHLDTLKADLASLGASLSADGDLLLYGCDVAQGAAGQALVQQLAALTGADVAASTDRTGASGDWVLEQSTGAIEAQTLAAKDWQGDLAITITGMKVNEGSDYAPFVIEGFTTEKVVLKVQDISTQGLINAPIKYSTDAGASWQTYTEPFQLTTPPTGGKIYVAVSVAPESTGSSTVEKLERYALTAYEFGADLPFAVDTDNLRITGETQFVMDSQVMGIKSVTRFNGSGYGANNQTPIVLDGQTIGSVTFPAPRAFDNFGGAGQTQADFGYPGDTRTSADGYVRAKDTAPVTINLTTPQDYFGFWWSAGDPDNILELYSGGQLIETFHSSILDAVVPSDYYGNPNTGPDNDSQRTVHEKYAFLNFFAKSGQSFDKIVMRGSNFEFDNLTFRKLPPGTSDPTLAVKYASGSGTIIDDGTGMVVKVDAQGNPVLANGGFVDDPQAPRDNDYDTTPSLNDCAYVAPVDLLANDVSSLRPGYTLDPTTIKLYSSLTSSGAGEGGSSLTTALGEFKVTETGVLYFNPNADFNGATDRITIYYTVSERHVNDYLGTTSARAAVVMDPQAVSAAMASNGATPVTTPYAQSNGNATELFFKDASGNPITASYSANTVAKTTSLTVDLHTNTNYQTDGANGEGYYSTIDDTDNNGGNGGVQARLKVDTTAVTTSSGANLAMGFGVPANTSTTFNFGGPADLLGLTGANRANYLADNYDAGLDWVRKAVGGGDNQPDYFTSQQLSPTTQDWGDFDPLTNAWVKFETGSLAVLANRSTATSYQIGTVTVTFQNPNGAGLGANNPLLHLAHLGGTYIENGGGTRGGMAGAQLQLVGAKDASGNAIAGVTLDKLSGNLAVNNTGLIASETVGKASYGTVKVNGSGVASVTFNVTVKGYWETYSTEARDTVYGGDFSGSDPNEVFYLSTSTFIGPDTLSAGVPKTGAGADAMNVFVRVCGVNDVVVNEGSPYAIFEVGGYEGRQILDLSLSSGTGTLGVDTGSQLQWYDPSANNGKGAWIDYNGGPITIPENGDGSLYMPTKLLVRVAVTNDTAADNGETLTLSATYPNEGTKTGTLTIMDNGTGSVFGAGNTTGTPDLVDTRFPHTALNDDLPDPRPITINSLTVNEGSPYAVFTVTGKEGQTLSLGSLTSGTGTAGTDTGPGLEYFNGTAWVPYTPGQSIRLGYGTDNVLDANADASLLVRVAVTNDLNDEPNETLTLTATPNGGTPVTGTLTIYDDGTGQVFGPGNTTGAPDTPGTNGAPLTLDDDTPDSRPVTINDVTVNEGSPFAVFTVGAAPGQRVVLGLPASGTGADKADVGVDTGTGLEYFNGTSWVKYVPGSQVETPASGKILVRVAVVQDGPFEGPQKFTLSASNTAGTAVTGTATIVDDGTGTLFATGVNPDGTPVVDTTTVPDDDRPLTVNNVTVNEASPYIVFTVSGGYEGQKIKLATQDVTASVGADTSAGLQYFNGTDWVNYDADSYITLPDNGNGTPEQVPLLVRLAVTQDSAIEGTESFKLIATNSSGKSATGIGKISDEGVGSLFAETNTTGTPDPLGSAALPAGLTALDLDGTPPAGCWSLGSVDLAEVFTPPAGQDVDIRTLDLDPNTAGIQTSKDVYETINGVSTLVGSYVLSGNNVTFVSNSAFRGTAPNITVAVNTVSIQVDGQGNTVLDANGLPVMTVTGTTTATVGMGASSTAANKISATEVCGVNSVVVNEGSPWAIFEVGGFEGRQISSLTLTSGTGTAGVDTGAMEYFNGTSWVPYVAGQPITVPSDGDGNAFEATKLLVRVAIVNDGPLETVNGVGEQLSLGVAYTNGPTKTGTLTILDNGTGNVFGNANTTGTPDVPGTSTDPSVPDTLNDDVTRLSVDDVTVNEGSPWMVFTINGKEGQAIGLSALAADTAVPGLDTATALEYFNGTAWVPYVAGSTIAIPSDDDAFASESGAKLLVRVAVKQDGIFETSESVKLTVTSGNLTDTAFGTILDDGTGTKWTFASVNDPGTATTAATPTLGFDDDRPLSVDDVWVYESSGYAVLDVSGAPGQWVTLALADGTATLGTDTAAANTLEYWDGSSWQIYTGAVQIPPGDGTLKVRLAVSPDATTETPETFTLTATNASGRAAVGTATILDGANPVPYGQSNGTSQCWDPVTINVLANDVVVSGTFNASSVLLHATATSAGVTTLTTDYGTYAVNANGTVTFTPVDTLPDGSWFNGKASVVYYSVATSAGTRLAPAEIHIGELIPVSGISTSGVFALNSSSTISSNSVLDAKVSLSDLKGGSPVFANINITNAIYNRPNDSYSVEIENKFLNWDYYYNDNSAFKARAASYITSVLGSGFIPSVSNSLEFVVAPSRAMLGKPQSQSTEYLGYLTISFTDAAGQSVSLDAVNISLTSMGDGQVAYPEYQKSTALVLDSWVSNAGSVTAQKVSGNTAILVTQQVDGKWKIENGASTFDPYDNAINGTVQFRGNGISSLTFRVGLDTLGSYNWPTDSGGDAWNMLIEVPAQSKLSADAVPTMVKTCGVNDVVVNEASPWAVFTVNGVEGQTVTLDLQDGTGIEGVDTNALQYLDPTDNTWKPYTPGQQLTLPNDGDGTVEKAKILVRVGIVNDAPFEKSEQLTLAATFDDGLVETGTLTILDDGTGNVFLDGNKTPVPNAPTDAGYPAKLNDDRGTGPLVNSIVVNERSPYAVFTINGVAGAGVNLALGAGGAGSTAELTGTDADIGSKLEFWDDAKSAWVEYTPNSPNAKVNADGKLQVRVAVVNDQPLEVSEDFTLTATYNNKGTTAGVTVGAASTGQGVIKDDGTGTIFVTSATDPGINNLGQPEIDLDTPKNFDGISINDVTVNEGSPYAVFTVGSVLPGAKVTLDLRDGSASTAGADYNDALEYFDGMNWVAYTGQMLDAPQTGGLLVRVPLNNQLAFEGPEQFYLTATLAQDAGGYKAGASTAGTGTIVDDGTGSVFGELNTTGTPDTLGTTVDPSLPQYLDDDSQPEVNNVTVNEGSPYAVFTVKATVGKQLNLGLANSGTGAGHAVLGTDTASGTGNEKLEYWNGSAWVPYTGAITVTGDMHAGPSPCLEEGESPNFDRSRVIVSSYHSSIFKMSDGRYFVAGEYAAPNGSSDLTTPVEISPANGYTYTGDIIDVLAASNLPQHALMTTEGLWVWGIENQILNTSLTDGTGFQKVALPKAIKPADVRFISGSEGAGLALVMKDGTVWMTIDSNYFGAPFYGDGSTTNQSGAFRQVMTEPDNPLTGVTDLEVTSRGVFAYQRATGTFYTWGRNVYLGDGQGQSTLSYATAMVSALPTGVDLVQLQAAATGTMSYFALGSDGQVYTLGVNDVGQAGQGNRATVLQWTTVKDTAGTGPLTNVSFLSASSATKGMASVSAVLKDGTLLSWGDNAYWMIGVDVDGDPATEDLVLLPTAPNWENNTPLPVQVVENGGHFTSLIARNSDGKITSVGHNPGGAFGDGSTDNRTFYVSLPFLGSGATLSTGVCTPETGEPADLLVRVAIKQDTNFEVSETYKLNANYTNGPVATGIGTIVDDGTGAVFGPNNSTGQPDAPGQNGIPANFVLDDDRALTVNNVTVNEASPHIVFTVTGKEGQLFNLGTASGTAVIGQDVDAQLQYLAKNCYVLPTTLDVLANDVAPVGKTLDTTSVRLFSAATGGVGSDVLTIAGQGTWLVNADGTVTFTPVDGLTEDAAITPVYYSVKDSSGAESGRSAIRLGADATSAAMAPAAGATGRFVRIEQTNNYLNMAEVKVMSGGVNVAQGKTATQSSDGWGGVASRAVDGNTDTQWGGNSISHTGDSTNPWWQVDLGREMSIDQIEVWGRSGYEGRLKGATVKILDAAGNVVTSYQLLGSLTETMPPPVTADDGAVPPEECSYTWTDYTPGTYLRLPDDGDATPGEDAKMLVRLAVKQDLPYEVSESFKLQATNTGGTTATGIGTILDGGTGDIFADPVDDPATPQNEATNPDGTPVLDTTTPKDDDRPLTVTGSTVREPGNGQTGFLTFTVSGIEGQPVKLALQSETGTVGTDTTGPLQYWNGTAWANYDPQNPPTIPQVGSGLNGETGQLQVRVAVAPDALTEGTESLTLVATNRNGTPFSAPGYILEGAGTVVPNAPPIAVTGQTVNEASPYLVYKVSGLIGQGLTLNLSETGTGNGHVQEDVDISCHMPTTTVNVLNNDVVNSTYDTINPASVRLFASSNGTDAGVTTLTNADGTYVVNSNGTVTFTPVDGLSQGAITPIYYTVKTSAGAESARGMIDLNSGATSAPAGTPQTAPWWQVDLGALTAIDSLAVFNRTDSNFFTRNNGATVAVLDENQAVVWSSTLSNPATASQTFSVPSGISGRYVKVSLPSMDFLSLAEVQVFSAGTNVALNKTATQSSTYYAGNPIDDGLASRAVDGNTDGSYFTGHSVTHTDWTLPPVTANDAVTGGANLACQELEYFDGTNWVYYVPGSTVNIPGGTNGQPGELLVRVRVVNDGVFEGPETLDLVATSTDGYVASGTGTIVDDGTGLINTNAVSNGAPVLDTATPRNDDRGANPSVNSFTVNEGSPFAVFTVTGVPGAGLTLGLSDGTAEPADHGTALEFFDTATSSWVSYNATTPNAMVQPDGRLLVRVALANDAPFEGPETFNLSATFNGTGSPTTPVTVGGSSAGTATIVDDGTGLTFLTRNDDPLTPANEANLGVMDGNLPQFDDITPKDDDRGVSVADVTVNEGSPYIVFSLDSFVGQKLQVAVGSDTAALGDVNAVNTTADASSSLEYWTGSAWVAYTPGSYIDVAPDAGQLPGSPKSVLVRLAVRQDNTYEIAEKFNLRVTTATGKSDSAIGTIVDNGSGTKWAFTGPTDPGTSGITSNLDDDRPFNPAIINNLTINEGSPWAVFTISGVPTAQLTLSLPQLTDPVPNIDGDLATKGTDYADGVGAGELQVYIQTAPTVWEWVDYDENAAFPAQYGTPTSAALKGNAVLDSNGQLLVRVKLENQTELEGRELLGLNLEYTGNWSQAANLSQTSQPQTGRVFQGYAAIVDDGTGDVFGNNNTTGVPTTPGQDGTPALRDDDRPLVVGSATVNEGSPYIVLPVTGRAGQWVQLAASSGTATLGTDTSSMEYWNGAAWVAYTPDSFVQIPTLPGQRAGSEQTLLVRLAVTNDTSYERSESFTLTATNTGGTTSAAGTGTILDNGTGPIYATGVPGNPSGVMLDANGQFTPVLLPSAPRNDDRTVTVDSVTVNEDSPYAVFTVMAAKGEPLLLNLASGTATVGTDTSGRLEYFDATTQQWKLYVPTLPVTVPANGSTPVVPMLVRVAVNADTLADNGETFTLTAQYADGNQASATGTGTIMDDGTGDVFATNIDDPTTPGVNEAALGINPNGTPAKLTLADTPVVNPATLPTGTVLADDDRPLDVDNLIVNEGSPFAVFTVGGREGQYVKLDLAPGTATAYADYVNALEYWNGQGWVAYTPGTFVQIPSDGDDSPNDGANLLVRVAIKPDTLADNGETFTLKATNTGGTSNVGTATIKDDGTGVVFATAPGVDGVEPATERTPVQPLTLDTATDPVTLRDNAHPVLADDDRPLTVDDVELNEASGYVMWQVHGQPQQYAQLSVASGSAAVGTDTAPASALQYFNGQQWRPYTADSFVKVPASGVLLVRLAVTNDFVYEGPETLTLTATNTGGTSDTGTATIRDDGKGLLFSPANNTGTPDSLATLGLQVLDDDRVAPPVPQPAAPAPAVVEAPKAPTAPALHVQVAVADGRQAVSVANPVSTSGAVVARAAGALSTGDNELHRTDVLIDKFDRVTDPHLYVLPEVKDTRGQAFEVKTPAIVMQSGLLMEELGPKDSVAALVKISQAPTSADQTLAELAAQPAAVLAEAEQDEQTLAKTLRDKQWSHLVASREALRLEAQERQTTQRGQMGFSKQLQMSALKRAAAARSQA